MTGHKFPTAFPSRRAWRHLVVRNREGQTVFESGALNPDGSIQGNDNDVDPTRFEPHYREITNRNEVQIYEPILKDQDGHVTTGLSAATGYLKDNGLLPSGFRKETADQDIAVAGDAASDPNFTDAGDLVAVLGSRRQMCKDPFTANWFPLGPQPEFISVCGDSPLCELLRIDVVRIGRGRGEIVGDSVIACGLLPISRLSGEDSALRSNDEKHRSELHRPRSLEVFICQLLYHVGNDVVEQCFTAAAEQYIAPEREDTNE